MPSYSFFTLINEETQPIASVLSDQGLDEANQEEALDHRWHDIIVQKGDTLETLFKRAHLSTKELYQLLQDPLAKDILERIHPGKKIRFKKDSQQRLAELWYPITKRDSLHIHHNDQGFHSEQVHYTQTEQLAFATANIQHSLFSAGAKAGIPDKITAQMTDLFSWEIDFAQDLRPNDHFSVLYKLTYLSNNKVLVGDIVAAEFVNKDIAHQAVLFIDPDGQKTYYTPTGKSLKRAFIRTPVKYTRISDPFNLNRRHPILHTIRPHKGVDYAAPRGTPIRATGDGLISFLGRKGGYGNAIVIKHNRRYTTLYGHLSHFARGLHAGSRVQQNQLIGYVGSTGLATGPHLHYEFRINGIHRNPMKVALPKSQPIRKNYREYFLSHAEQFIHLLHHYPKSV